MRNRNSLTSNTSLHSLHSLHSLTPEQEYENRVKALNRFYLFVAIPVLIGALVVLSLLRVR